MRNQILGNSRKPFYIFFLILATFFLKGLFLAALFPIFQGYDEHKHFSRIEFNLEPVKKSWPINKMTGSEYKAVRKEYEIATFHYSEEITKTAQNTQFDPTRKTVVNSPFLSDSSFGPEELSILDSNWKRYIDVYPPTMASHPKFNYFLPTIVDKVLYNQSIFVRFFTIRLLSIISGCLILIFAFITVKKAGFSENNSLIFTSILAFQPVFSSLTSVISSDPMLIAAFTLFTFSAVSIIKDNLGIKNGLLIIIAIIWGLLIKAPAIVLVMAAFPLVLYAISKKWNIRLVKLLALSLIIIFLLALLLYSLYPSSLLSNIGAGETSHFSSLLKSLTEYFKDSKRDLSDSGLTYWGNFGWLELPIAKWTIKLIWTIEFVALIGLVLYLFSKKRRIYLPSKTIVLFCALLVVLLELAIRFYDWRVFDKRGWILIGTNGRYFMPVIAAYFILIITGLGYWIKNEKNFGRLLKAIFVLMLILQVYSIFNIIIPRYYF